jgi:L-fuculose-phosphate aldolase
MNELQKKYESQIEELAETSRRLGELGFVTSHGGNLSYKVDDDVILITPTKVLKRKIRFEDIIIITNEGKELYSAADRKKTGETPMHVHLYKIRPDINALVHAHPPVLTGFSMTDCNILARPLLPEPIIELGPILPVNYAEPISDALAAEFDTVVEKSNAWLMKNHGIIIASTEGVGRTLDLLELAEAQAISVRTGLAVGKINEIPRDEVKNLENTIRIRNIPRVGDPRKIKSLIDIYF